MLALAAGCSHHRRKGTYDADGAPPLRVLDRWDGRCPSRLRAPGSGRAVPIFAVNGLVHAPC